MWWVKRQVANDINKIAYEKMTNNSKKSHKKHTKQKTYLIIYRDSLWQKTKTIIKSY